jgi:hypothetical protein
MRKTITLAAGLLFTSAFLAAAQLRGILLVFGPRIRDHVAAAQGVTQGLPHWRGWQSRVLGPFFVEILSRLTGLSFADAYPLAVFVLLLLFFLVLLSLARSLWNSTIAALGIALAAWTFNGILMQGLWVYLWDYIDLIVFTLLTWAIVAARPLWLVALILLVEAFNREATIIISFWLLLDAVARPVSREGRWFTFEHRVVWKQILVALGLLAVASTIAAGLRHALFVREVGPDLFPELLNIMPATREPGALAHLELSVNLRFLRYSFTHPLDRLYMVFNVLVFAIPVLAVKALLSRHVDLIRLALLYLGFWALTIALGIIYETRVWLCFVPFLVLVGPILLANHPPGFLTPRRADPPIAAPEAR